MTVPEYTILVGDLSGESVKKTSNIRWLIDRQSPGRVLQEQWEFRSGYAVRYEWRDIPVSYGES